MRLHEDFVESIAGQTRALNFLEQQLSDKAVILSSPGSCAVAPEDSILFELRPPDCDAPGQLKG